MGYFADGPGTDAQQNYANYQQVVGAFSQDNGGQRYAGTQYADAAGSRRAGVVSDAGGGSMTNEAARNVADRKALSAQVETERALNNMSQLADDYAIARAAGSVGDYDGVPTLPTITVTAQREYDDGSYDVSEAARLSNYPAQSAGAGRGFVNPTLDSGTTYADNSDPRDIRTSFAYQSRMARAMADAASSNASVSPTYKGLTSALGLVTDGLGVVAGVAMTGTGIALTAAPEPTTLTKWAGVPLTAYGATYTAKSVVGFGLNLTNLVSAIGGASTEASYMPGSALEWAVGSSGGSPEAERVAVAADLAWGLTSGRVLDARLATGVITNPRTAALLQPAVTTSVVREATILAPGVWGATARIEPRAGLLDLGFKVNDNVVQPLIPPSNK